MKRIFASSNITRLLIGLALLPAMAFAQNFVTTYAGTNVAGLMNGDTLTALFDQPSDIDRDAAGNLIVVDLDHVLRQISPAGIVSTLAGTGVAGYLDGPGITARFNGALNACTDPAGNVYVSDFQNQRIRKIDPSGNVTTIAGNGVAGYKDSTALEASFRYPRGICRDTQGNLYISDSWNHRIRKLDTNGNVTTLAGGGTSMGVQSIGAHVDGPDTSARFWTPCGLEIDAMGNLYLADAYNHRIRKITPQGVVTTHAGSGSSGSANGGYQDGSALTARFNIPTGLGIDDQGDVYVADTYNNCIRYVSGGSVTTAAGSPTPGYLNGNSSIALFNHPRTALMDASGNHFYIPDGNNHTIRKLILNLTVGIVDRAADVAMASVYPNPSSNEIVIALRDAARNTEIQVNIQDATGKIVLQQSAYHLGAALDTQALSAGVYVARIVAQGQVHWVKFVKG